MQIKDLKKSMQSELEEEKPKQAVFDIHLNHIEKLLNEGYTIPLLCKKLDLGIKPNYFKNLIITARHKIKHKNDSVTESKITIGENESDINNDVSIPDIENWKSIFHDISPHLVKDIIKLNLNIDDIKSMIRKHSILDTFQLRKRINELKDDERASKYR